MVCKSSVILLALVTCPLRTFRGCEPRLAPSVGNDPYPLRPGARHQTRAALSVPSPRASLQLARLAFRVRRAFLDRDRDGLLVFFVGVVLLRVAAAVYFLTHLLVAAAPVVMLASGVACVEINQFRVRSSSEDRHRQAIEQVSRRWRACRRGVSGEGAVNLISTQGVAIANFASNTTRRVVGQWGGAGGAVCEDHLTLAWGRMRD